MFENLGRYVQTFFMIVIVALLVIAMGVFGFGTPTADGCSVEGPTYAAQVYDSTITEGDFRAAYAAPQFVRYPTERAQALRLKELTLDGLIERELLVHEADRLGFAADPDEVFRNVAENETILLGGPVDAPEGYPRGEIPQSFRDREGRFSADYLNRIIRNQLRRSIEEFTDWQVRETRANMVRDAITASVSVSPREVWDSYVQNNDRAQLAYVKFDPAYYRERVEMSDEAVVAWMEENTEAVDEQYRRQRHRYTNLPEQTRARHILIEVGREAEETERSEARARAERLLAQVRGGADFATLARDNSGDEGSAARGGDLGWFPHGQMVAPFDEAAFSTEPGQLVEDLVESDFGYHIIFVEGRREGDVPEEEAKREISEELYRGARAGELARADADRALAFLREGNSTDELAERLRNDWEVPEASEGDASEEDDEEPPPPTDPRAPQIRETLSFSRSERAGPFDTGPMTQAAFEMTMDDPLPEEPIELGAAWYIFQLIERQEASEEGFDADERARVEALLLDAKRNETLSAYIGILRARAEAEGALRINEGILSYGTEDDEDGESDDEEDGPET